MKIIFIGSVEFSAKTLEKLLEVDANIVGIITKESSDFNSDFSDLKPIAKLNGIPALYANNINSEETLLWIREFKPDILMCFGWSNLIKKEVLEVAPMGVVGFHPTLLPNNRGRHPLIWAKALGLDKSGNTFFFMDEGADTGDILSQKPFKINKEDDASSLYQKMVDLAIIQIPEFHDQLKSGNYPRISQDKNAGNTWRKRSIKDGLIDFRLSTQQICNLVRALTKPYVGAHIGIEKKNYVVWKVEEGEAESLAINIEPGKVLSIVENKIQIKTGDGSVWLVNHELKALPKIGTYL
ncbi:formyltransferase family protein [Flavobacteriaceae bacterium]|nr:formyltransferase family protein [Flavobacteriaceae bacterium]